MVFLKWIHVQPLATQSLEGLHAAQCYSPLERAVHNPLQHPIREGCTQCNLLYGAMHNPSATPSQSGLFAILLQPSYNCNCPQHNDVPFLEGLLANPCNLFIKVVHNPYKLLLDGHVQSPLATCPIKRDCVQPPCYPHHATHSQRGLWTGAMQPLLARGCIQW